MGDLDFLQYLKMIHGLRMIFYWTLANVLNKMYLLRRPKMTRAKFARKPWITQVILNSTNRENRLYKVYLA